MSDKDEDTSQLPGTSGVITETEGDKKNALEETDDELQSSDSSLTLDFVPDGEESPNPSLFPRTALPDWRRSAPLVPPLPSARDIKSLLNAEMDFSFASTDSGSSDGADSGSSDGADSGSVSGAESVTDERDISRDGGTTRRRRKRSGRNRSMDLSRKRKPQGDFGCRLRVARVSLRGIFSKQSRIYHGILNHDVLGDLNATFKLCYPFEHHDVVDYYVAPRHHPNILERIDTGFAKTALGRQIYIAMERCHHESLYDYVQSQIRNGYPFRADKYVSYSHQLALAVEFLHHRKIVIGNLSPGVILLSVDKTTIKICDFGSIAATSHRFNPCSISSDISDLGYIFWYLYSYRAVKGQWLTFEGQWFVFSRSTIRSALSEERMLIPNSTLARSLIERMLAENPLHRPLAKEIVRHEIFTPYEKASSDGGGEEISDIVDDVEGLHIAGDDTETRIRNVISGIAITKSLTTVVPMEGDRVLVGGCYVTFPPEAFDEPTRVKLVAEIDSSKWPPNFTGYTPTLYVTAEGLRKKLHLRLPSWRVCIGSQKAKAYILHKWKYTDTTLSVTSEPYFEFDWGDFCPIVVGNSTKLDDSTALRMSGAVFVSEDAEVSVVYHINDQSSSSAESLIIEAISANMAKLVPPKHLKLRLHPFVVKKDEEIRTYITCEDPTDLKFKPSDPFTFTIDDEFGEKLEHHGVVCGKLHEQQRIVLQCIVRRKDETQIGNPSMFTCYWTPRQNQYLPNNVVKRKKPKKSKHGGVNFLLDQRKMAAHSIADRGATLSNVQTGSKVQIGVDSSFQDGYLSSSS